jgi:hypothetical protein
LQTPQRERRAKTLKSAPPAASCADASTFRDPADSPNETPVLIEAAQSLEDAMVRSVALGETVPGDYIVVSRSTGERILFMAGGGIKRI